MNGNFQEEVNSGYHNKNKNEKTLNLRTRYAYFNKKQWMG